MTWAGHIEPTREMKSAYRIFVGKPEGKSHTEDLYVDRRTILE
jgi:hypothetical protein